MELNEISIKTIVFRVPQATHKKITSAAKQEGLTLNDYVLKLVLQDLKEKGLVD